jgi:hypothetical protein
MKPDATDKTYEVVLSIPFDRLEEAVEYRAKMLDAWCEMEINKHLACFSTVKETTQ